MYENEYNEIKNYNGSIALKEDYKRISINANKKEILQINMEGNIVAEYDSISEAERVTGFLVSNISACCSGVSKSSNGFIWMYKNDYENNQIDIKDIIESTKPKTFKKGVVCVNLKDNFKYEKYESAREAERKVGLDYKSISYRCRKKYNNKDENIWMFEEDFIIIDNDEPLSVSKIDDFKISKYNL